MRKPLLFLLLASAGAPAFAAVADDGDGASRREAARAERAEARQERRADRPQCSEPQAEARSSSQSTNRVELREQRRETAGDRAIQRQQVRQQRAETPGDRAIQRQQVRQQRAETPGERAIQRQQAREAARTARPSLEQRQTDRQQRRDDRLASRRPPAVTPPPGARPDVQAPPPPTTTTAHRYWSPWYSSWRHDRRYDWRRYRDRNRWRFNLGFYYDPFGWGYRRYPIGWRLWPSYYGSSYWLNDPWSYRLPPAYGPYRWVRYWDDALLVNIYTGQVVDVIHSFFW